MERRSALESAKQLAPRFALIGAVLAGTAYASDKLDPWSEQAEAAVYFEAPAETVAYLQSAERVSDIRRAIDYFVDRASRVQAGSGLLVELVDTSNMGSHPQPDDAMIQIRHKDHEILIHGKQAEGQGIKDVSVIDYYYRGDLESTADNAPVVARLAVWPKSAQDGAGASHYANTWLGSISSDQPGYPVRWRVASPDGITHLYKSDVVSGQSIALAGDQSLQYARQLDAAVVGALDLAFQQMGLPE